LRESYRWLHAPKLCQLDRAIAIIIQAVEMTNNPGKRLGFLPIQPSIKIPIGLLKMTLQA
jgi:hypothetical protein